MPPTIRTAASTGWAASTVGTLLANAVAPGVLDRYLGQDRLPSQQTNSPRSPDQPANLWQPADGPDGQDFGAHGIFDTKSSPRSGQLWASQHHLLLAGLGAIADGGGRGGSGSVATVSALTAARAGFGGVCLARSRRCSRAVRVRSTPGCGGSFGSWAGAN